LFAKERCTAIIALLNETGAVTTAGLMEKFGVSIETVRRDLLFLEKQKLIQRVHGGAMLFSEMKSFDDLSHRLEENKEEKTELCKTAAKFVNNDDIIAIDSGSTAVYFASALKQRLSRLKVITHSLDVFNILSDKDGFEVILCGGNFDKTEKAFYGNIALDVLSNFHVTKSFIFPSAISVKNGVCDFNNSLILLQKKLLSVCDKSYFLADSNKFEKNAFIKICDMNINHTYITDSRLDCNLRKIYEENGFNIIC